MLAPAQQPRGHTRRAAASRAWRSSGGCARARCEAAASVRPRGESARRQRACAWGQARAACSRKRSPRTQRTRQGGLRRTWAPRAGCCRRARDGPGLGRALGLLAGPGSGCRAAGTGECSAERSGRALGVKAAREAGRAGLPAWSSGPADRITPTAVIGQRATL